MKIPHALWLAAVALVRPAAAGSPPPDPLDARAPVPPAVHRSILPRPAASAPDVSWAEANARVARIGGWRAYQREAAASAPSASTPQPHHHGGPR